MYPARTARELGILLRISRELDVVGDLTAIVDDPSELLAWTTALTHPTLLAWRAADSGSRYVQVSAHHDRAPIRGQITAVLHCDQHLDFWHQLSGTHDLHAGDTAPLSVADLSHAWEAMPLAPPS